MAASWSNVSWSILISRPQVNSHAKYVGNISIASAFWCPVVDPEFCRLGYQPQRGSWPIIWHNFWQKLHENERSWIGRWTRVPRLPRFATDVRSDWMCTSNLNLRMEDCYACFGYSCSQLCVETSKNIIFRLKFYFFLLMFLICGYWWNFVFSKETFSTFTWKYIFSNLKFNVSTHG